MKSVQHTRTIEATPDAAWAVLADFGALSSWVPMIQHSCLLTDQTDGVGAVRRVQIANQTLVERVVVWEPGQRLTYTIEGLPPIVGAARNTWQLEPPAAGTSTTVTLTTEIDTGRNPLKAAIAGKVLERMSMASEFMLAGLDTATTDASPGTTEGAPQ